MTDNAALPILASAARTEATATDKQINHFYRGGHFIIDVTAGSGFSITPYIEGFDYVSGKWYTLLQGVAITATGTTVLKILPGITPVVNAAANDMLPHTYRFRMAAADATPATYSVGVNLGGL